VNHALLAILNPAHIEVEIWREDDLAKRRGLSSELDDMWSYVRCKSNPRWLWHAIDHHTGKVLAYVFGRRQDAVFLQLKALLEPFGITRYYSILKFFQFDVTGIFRITSMARYFKEGVGPNRPSWRWIMCFLERLKVNISCKAWVKRFSWS
jgi:hypothetical protein